MIGAHEVDLMLTTGTPSSVTVVVSGRVHAVEAGEFGGGGVEADSQTLGFTGPAVGAGRFDRAASAGGECSARAV
jgi:hypothetical protein